MDDLASAVSLLISEVDELCFALEPPRALASFIRQQRLRVEKCLELAALRPYTADMYGTSDVPQTQVDVEAFLAKPSA